MVSSKPLSVLPPAREKSLLARVPHGHTPLHAHWEYYLRLMRET